MKWLIGILILILVVGCAAPLPEEDVQPADDLEEQGMINMKLTSPAFEHEGSIPAEYTCVSENYSPELHISDVPSGAKSLALVMDDPDAIKPANKVWDHWVVWNIPTDTKVLDKNVQGLTEGVNTGGTNRYIGPCPPDGEHRYYFKLYALDTELDLPESTTKTDLEKAMEGHILEETQLMGRFTK